MLFISRYTGVCSCKITQFFINWLLLIPILMQENRISLKNPSQSYLFAKIICPNSRLYSVMKYLRRYHHDGRARNRRSVALGTLTRPLLIP